MNNNITRRINLESCLNGNSSLLGQGCTWLGKYKPSENNSLIPLLFEDLQKKIIGYFCDKKVLLSYTKKRGWKVVELNRFQCFLRKFGWHQSTYLDHIAKKILRENGINNNVNQCRRHILQLWGKKNLIALGNANLSDAKVVCFAEKHGDKLYYAACRLLCESSQIHKYTIRLAEGCKVTEKKNRHTLEGNPYLFVGWEPENLDMNNFQAFANARVKNDALKQCRLLHLKKFLEDSTELHLDGIVKEIDSLNEYYQSKAKLVLEADTVLKGAFQEFRKGELSKEELGAKIEKILSKLEKNQLKAIYKNLTLEEKNQFDEVIPLRNASLVNQIDTYALTAIHYKLSFDEQNEKYRLDFFHNISSDYEQKDVRLGAPIDREDSPRTKTGAMKIEGDTSKMVERSRSDSSRDYAGSIINHTVIVQGGAAHFLNFPGKVRCDEVKDCLKKHKFIIVLRKKLFTKKVARLNLDISPILLQ